MNVNPFAGFGTCVVGDRLIGRESILSEHADTVLAGLGSLSLVGLPRVGKSSIASEIFERARRMDDVVPLWVDASTQCVSTPVAVALLESLELAGFRLDGSGRDAPVLRSVLRSIRSDGRRVLAVIDEFDAIRMRESGDDCIRLLRELIYRPREFALSVVFVSRRPLKSIQRVFRELSTLAGTCTSIVVPLLDSSGLGSMINRGWPAGSSPCSVGELMQLSAGQPLVAEAALFSYWAGRSASEVRAVSRQHQEGLFDAYMDLVGALVEEGSHLEARELGEQLARYGLSGSAFEASPVLGQLFEEYIGGLEERRPTWATEALLRARASTC